MTERKCYIMWLILTKTTFAGGKAVWHTDDEVVMLALKHKNLILKPVPPEKWTEMEKYSKQRVDLK